MDMIIDNSSVLGSICALVFCCSQACYYNCSWDCGSYSGCSCVLNNGC